MTACRARTGLAPRSASQVERLATGLRGAPHVLVAGLNVRTAHLTTGSSTVNAGGAKSPPLTTREFLASVTSVSAAMHERTTRARPCGFLV